MGTVLGLVNDSDSTNPAKPVTPVRYLYTPYGEAHAETAPEVLGVKFVTKINDVPVTSITDLLGATRTQTVADATTAASGMLRVVLSLPAESATLGSVLSVETSITKDVWSPVAESQYAIGQKPERPEEIDVLPLSGWNRGASYRVTLAPSLTDKVGRAMGSQQSFEWPIPGSGDVAFEKSFPLNYETYLAAGESAGGAFVGGQPMGFQGAYSDNLTGLQYKRARFYDPRTLEFLSEDSAMDRDSPNLYTYTAWKPSAAADTMGRWLTLIHNEMIDAAFQFDLPSTQIDTLKRASRFVDNDQSVEGSYKHGMRAPWELPTQAEMKWRDFVDSKFREATRLIQDKKPNAAFFALGEGMHAIMDSTSPRHRGSQVWYGLGDNRVTGDYRFAGAGGGILSSPGANESVQSTGGLLLPGSNSEISSTVGAGVHAAGEAEITGQLGELVGSQATHSKDFNLGVELIRGYYKKFEPLYQEYLLDRYLHPPTPLPEPKP